MFLMEKQMFATKEEFENLKREVNSLKSTFEIMQDNEIMQDIEENEEAKKKSVKTWKIKSN